MAERNMGTCNSGGSSGHRRGHNAKHGKNSQWEEAQGEFYQCQFLLEQGTATAPSTEDETDIDAAAVNSKGVSWENKIDAEGDENDWKTLLPSKRAKSLDARTWGRTAISRRMSTRTLRNGSSPTAAELEMEYMPDLASGLADEQETWDQLQNIRNLPISMEAKRQLKAEIMRAPTFRMRGLDLLKFRRRQIWHKLQHSVMHLFSIFSPWKASLRLIEANFGTGVASYFMLIRWLFLLNIFTTLFVSVFIIVPWTVGQQQTSCPDFNISNTTDEPFSGCVKRLNHTNCDANCVLRSDACWNDYSLSVAATAANHSSEPLELIQDAVQGTGWLELTISFYGFYQPALLKWADDYVYNFALGYQLTIYFLLLFSLACMSKSVATGFKLNMGLGRSWLHQFSDLAFTSWDYCIDSAKVAQLKKKAIMNAIRVALAEKAYAEEKAARTARLKIRLFFIRLGINLLVVLTLSLTGYIIYLVTDYSEKFRRDLGDPDGSFNEVKDLWILLVGFLPSIAITALNAVIPFLFRALVLLERYSATMEIKMTLVRTVLLRLASLLFLVLTLYSSLRNAESELPCHSKALNVHAMCWETYVGQQLFRLCIFDAAITITMTVFVELPLALSFRRSVSPTSRLNFVAHPEFNLVANTLNLVYGQSICWLGMFYCPLLPLATAIKCIFVFYVKYLSLAVYSSPPSRLYGASSSSSLFMNVLLVSFITCVLPVGYHVTSLRPSSSCGPFRGSETVWSAVSNEVNLMPETIREVLFFFGTAGFFVPAIIVLIVALYYYRSKASAHRAMAESLTQQLILEAEDKQFLIARLSSSPNAKPKLQAAC